MHVHTLSAITERVNSVVFSKTFNEIGASKISVERSCYAHSWQLVFLDGNTASIIFHGDNWFLLGANKVYLKIEVAPTHESDSWISEVQAALVAMLDKDPDLCMAIDRAEIMNAVTVSEDNQIVEFCKMFNHRLAILHPLLDAKRAKNDRVT